MKILVMLYLFVMVWVYDKDHPDTTIDVRLLAWNIKLEKRKALKKEINEELISIVRDPTR